MTGLQDSNMAAIVHLWRCPDCGWVGFSEDGHCRQFDEHPEGPRIPLESVEYVPRAERDRYRTLLAELVGDVEDYGGAASAQVLAGRRPGGP